MIKAWRLAWLPFVLAAGPAHAHSPIPGIKGFYTGLLHPFSTPSQVLLTIGLGLLAGGFATETERYRLVVFPISGIVGLVVAPDIAELDAAMFAAAFAACALAALVPGRLHVLAVVLVAAGGFLIGVASIPDDGPVRDRLFTMSGSIVGASIGLLYLAGISLAIRERYTWPWVGIAFRVLSAWLGAISLLMFSLGLAAGET
ncbi:HupE/UreJ family protein [Sedimentitalea sp. JM2-8]|uniref:HupE/UreJ family protein n=1 Tax=Sedimentitalea xiamensis TaxID=3050037 RepID=A0ABT7F8N9_9RHOB|nr:HupE/UreJ family protein [Sedimentitalea xiamensis]MDK3071479.1 HupE/UreJ family protein [Sedimentitalea xiamensis]